MDEETKELLKEAKDFLTFVAHYENHPSRWECVVCSARDEDIFKFKHAEECLFNRIERKLKED